MWRIRHGATEVVYCMDVNLKRETVLDGAGLGLLPSVPELLIVEGGSVSRFAPSPLGSTVPGKKRKDKDDATGLIAAVMDTHTHIYNHSITPPRTHSLILLIYPRLTQPTPIR